MGNPILGVYNSLVGPGFSIFDDPAQAGVANLVDGLDDDKNGLDFFVPPATTYAEEKDFTDAVGAFATAFRAVPLLRQPVRHRRNRPPRRLRSPCPIRRCRTPTSPASARTASAGSAT